MTTGQKKLFNLMADFATDTVVGWCAEYYKYYGYKAVINVEFAPSILRFAEAYFNNCAHWIYNHKDQYINEKFGEMLAIPFETKYDPIDILNMIVMLSLYALNTMEISSVVSDNYELSMKAIKVHIRAIVERQNELAMTLNGCTHIHEKINESDRVYSFSVGKYVQTEQGEVKLTEL